ncbi:MAG TPA: hypothetical protein PL033_07055 [Candidatus Brocadiia bacterium]|nr:hypothetical protein [Candidatus Brocadiia bacterium]
MLMTSARLIIMRGYLLTLGRLSIFTRLLRWFLLKLLVRGKKEKYVPSARFFSMNELED